MRITDARVAMSGDHQFQQQRQLLDSKGITVDRQALALQLQRLAPTSEGNVVEGTGVSRADSQEWLQAEWLKSGAALSRRMQLNKLILEGFLGRSLLLAHRFVAAATDSPNPSAIVGGFEIRRDNGVDLNRLDASLGSSLASSLDTSVAGLAVEAPEDLFAGRFRLLVEEREQTKVVISASVEDSNGRVIDVHLEQQMSRQLSVEREASSDDISRFMDPLVVNFSGTTRLSSSRTEFDLDGDGELELIPRFASDSAYVALDRNGDGVINDGSELFGVASGNGFADLAKFDSDGNGFIDEADSVFRQLLLYRPGLSGVAHLAQANIEALHLGYVDSPFALKSSSGDDLGRIRSTGFYLAKSGQHADAGIVAGSLQQVDLAV